MNQAVRQLGNDLQDATSRLQDIYAPIIEPLEAVNLLLREHVDESGPVLAERLSHSGLTSGKRVRPALLLLCGACLGDLKRPHVAAAAAVELIHAASLVHDDVLDNADQRRHELSLNARWDNTTSILTGDYLFSKAFEVATAAGNIDVIRRIARSSSQVCEGEICQNAASGDFEISEEEYFRIIELKTAELCKCSCGLGAILSESDSDVVEAFETYGNHLGTAFQIIDDVLDLVGNRQQVGKTLGTDLLNQKATLPIIHCLASLEQRDIKLRNEMILQLSSCERDEKLILRNLMSTNSVEYARRIARTHAEMAGKFVDTLPESIYRESLRQLATFVIQRTH